MGRVGRFHSSDAERPEQLSDFRYVVEGKDKLAPEGPQTLFEFGEVFPGEVEPIKFPIPVGRIEIKQRCRPIVAGDKLFKNRL